MGSYRTRVPQRALFIGGAVADGEMSSALLGKPVGVALQHIADRIADSFGFDRGSCPQVCNRTTPPLRLCNAEQCDASGCAREASLR